MKIIVDDLIKLALEGEIDVVVHGCNCFCAMGAGIAKTIAETFPDAVRADKETMKGDHSKLGTCSVGKHIYGEHTITIVNAYTQDHWDGDGVEVLVDYDAVRACMRFVKSQFRKKRIGIPLIGAGLARGDWARIERIILEELDGCDVTIVHFS